MTRDELLAEVRLIIKRDTTGFADTYILTRIGWAIEDIGLAYDWSEMMKEYSFTLTASTSTYSFPSRMKNIYSLRLATSNGIKVLQLSPRRFDTEFPKPSLLGESDPTHYNDYGDRFELLPTPDSALTGYLKCSVLAQTLASGSSTPDLVRKDRLIVALASMYCFEALQEPQLVQVWRQNASEAYQRCLQGDRKPKDWEPLARPFNGVTRVTGEPWKTPFA